MQLYYLIFRVDDKYKCKIHDHRVIFDGYVPYIKLCRIKNRITGWSLRHVNITGASVDWKEAVCAVCVCVLELHVIILGLPSCCQRATP
jgi:hypothetical protein